ncbi:MAG: fused MFS/spermidine synthase, partial [Chloroflexota bacterium]|nr:fused MFS/spermidine synthase [Chloroflexota bacterium]
DLIVGDAFNDYSVPYHLTTLEFSRQLHDLLSDDGIYLANIIDKLRPSRFLRAFVYTLEAIYPHVYILGQDADIPFPYYLEELDRAAWSAEESHTELERDLRESGNARATFVVAASRQPIDFSQFRPHHTHEFLRERTTFVMAEADRQRWLQQGPVQVLTDDHAPVDTMVAALFTDDNTQWHLRILVPPPLRRFLPGG